MGNTQVEPFTYVSSTNRLTDGRISSEDVKFNTQENIANLILLNKYSYRKYITANIKRELPLKIWLRHMELIVNTNDYHDYLCDKEILENFHIVVIKRFTRNKDYKHIYSNSKLQNIILKYKEILILGKVSIDIIDEYLTDFIKSI